MSVQQMRDATMAMGLAVPFAASHHPFGSYRADTLVGSILGQIRRRHYVFVVRQGTIIGYVGWALCQPDVATAWIVNGQTPTFEQCSDGDVVVPIIAIADERSALRLMVSHVRNLYGGKSYMGRRALREANAIRSGRITLAASTELLSGAKNGFLSPNTKD
jgi:hemolysin-activating ACP:hemolysin acyltransferase